MNELDYFKGQWTEFKKWEEQQHNDIRYDIREISNKIDDLNGFKWKVIGAASVLSFITTTLGAMLIKHLMGS